MARQGAALVAKLQVGALGLAVPAFQGLPGLLEVLVGAVLGLVEILKLGLAGG